MNMFCLFSSYFTTLKSIPEHHSEKSVCLTADFQARSCGDTKFETFKTNRGICAVGTRKQ